MKKTLTLGIGICAITMVSFDIINRSDGAPVSATGAPDEVTCATTGCHDDNAMESGNAIVSIHSTVLNQEFIPGETYPITVRITEAGVDRFGYQLVALDDNGNNAGDFVVTDAERTQTFYNQLELTDREYATYTYEGTSPFVEGVGEWTIDWIAPNDIENITFYAACVSADNDGTDKGDIVYEKNLSWVKSATSSVSELNLKPAIQVNKNSLLLKNSIGEKLMIVDMNGKVVSEKLVELKSEEFDFSSLATGVYIARIGDTIEKFMIK